MKCTVVGHITRDLIRIGNSTDERMGGGAYYSGLALSKFCRVTLVTSFGKDIPKDWIDELESNFELHVVPSPRTTTFELVYMDQTERKIFLRSLAGRLDEAVDERERGIIIFNPVAGEVSRSTVERMRADKFVDVQGFLRGSSEGEVKLQAVDASFLRGSLAVHADSSEAANLRNLEENLPEVLIVSNGVEKGTAYVGGEKFTFEPLKIPMRDSTGAGDVFLGSFAGFYKRTTVLDALRKSVAFTAMFLSMRSFEFSLRDVERVAKKVRIFPDTD